MLLADVAQQSGLWHMPVLNLSPSPMLPRVYAGMSRARVVLPCPSRLARPTPVTTTLFICQPLQALLQKPLRPFVDKATANPDRGGNVGNRHAISHE